MMIFIKKPITLPKKIIFLARFIRGLKKVHNDSAISNHWTFFFIQSLTVLPLYFQKGKLKGDLKLS